MGYTVLNLRELEDSAVAFGLSPQVEARFGRRALGMNGGGVSYQRLAPGYRQAFGHRHERQEELYVIVAGSGRVALGDDVVELCEWDAVRVSPETIRAFEAGSDGLAYLAFGMGPGGDTEMFDGFWAGEER